MTRTIGVDRPGLQAELPNRICCLEGFANFIHETDWTFAEEKLISY